jgi:HTH-type transcriptional regulator / antitoxin HipB
MNDIDEISPIDYLEVMEEFPTQSIRSLRQAAAALRARRRARGMTQKQLAETTGTAQSTISDIETGVVSVSLDVYLRLLEALGAELTVTGRQADRDLL